MDYYLVQESGGENDVRFIIRIELDDHEISIVWEMVSIAEGKIFGVGCPNGTVGELRGGVGEDGVPPIKETRGIAFRRNRVVPCTMARGNWYMSAEAQGKRKMLLTRTTNNADGDGLAKKCPMYDLLYSSAAA